MRDSIARGDSILDADMDFHLAISKAAQNEVLRNAVQLLRNLMRQGIYYKLLKRGSAHSERVYRSASPARTERHAAAHGAKDEASSTGHSRVQHGAEGLILLYV
jgi:DNA-binding FadR family transcriptional regulator